MKKNEENMNPKNLMHIPIPLKIKNKFVNKFVDVGTAFPIPYELVTLKLMRKKHLQISAFQSFIDDDMQIKLSDQHEIKYIEGWWTGHDWDGYKLLKSDKVLAWKKVTWDQSR